ncbi:12136_t:CDS:2 [Entrophospora sp. SA101]|nr:12136_t:CDS:2 [Entrophospora sp. SA101]
MAAYYPEVPSYSQQKSMNSFLKTFSEFYPCWYCAEHLRNEMKKYPPKVESKWALGGWLCDMHNIVNDRLGKTLFDCSKIDERWKDGPKDVGQKCFTHGDVKSTYGTGCFMLFNSGKDPVISESGLLTTVGYKFGSQDAIYVLEGSIAVAVKNTGGVYFVTAFSGLFTPYWHDDACCCIVDILNIEVNCPAMRETTALGAAIAAGFAVKIWNSLDDLKNVNTKGHTIFSPMKRLKLNLNNGKRLIKEV